jgi:putative transposase
LSASAIGRLKDGWLDDHTAWQRRDLSAKRYVYIWADGIHLQHVSKTKNSVSWC